MQGVAYILDGQPMISGASDESRLQAIIDSLPPGAGYQIVSEEEATAWWIEHRPVEEFIKIRKAELHARLAAIDAESIRPLRSIADGTATEADRARLAGLESEAAELRAELAGVIALLEEYHD